MPRSGLSVTAAMSLGVFSVAPGAWAVFGRIEPLGIPCDAPETLAYFRRPVGLVVLGATFGTKAACSVSMPSLDTCAAVY